MPEPIACAPAELSWGERAPDGVRRAPLEGTPSQEGPVTFAVNIPRGAWSHAHVHNHVHNQDVRVFVASGCTVWVMAEKSSTNAPRRIRQGPSCSFLRAGITMMGRTKIR